MTRVGAVQHKGAFMITALDYYESVPPFMRMDITKIREWLDHLPDPEEKDERGRPELWSCHGIARAVHARFSLGKQWAVCDGFFARHGNQHSWLARRRTKKEPTLVLDVYPVASIGGPLMVDISSCGSPWCGMYIGAYDYYLNEQVEAVGAEAVKILQLAEVC